MATETTKTETMAKTKEFDMDAEFSPLGVRIRLEGGGGCLTRQFRVKHPNEAKADDNKRRKELNNGCNEK